MRHISAVACFFALSVLLAGCGTRVEPTPAPKASVSARSLPAVRAAADTPAPTPTRPPLPPTIVSISPDRGEEQVLAAPVTVTFDQPMDAASTGGAFSIEPKVPGQVQVKGNQLIFSPTERLKRETEYQVKVDATASSAAGLHLLQDVTFKFVTAGFLQVTDVQPGDQSSGVPVDAALVVAFNRPVIPLSAPTAGGADGGPSSPIIDPLVITPTVKGAGEWVTTSIYRLTPATGLAASSDYTVTVKAGLEDTMGGQLAVPYTFTFHTADPAVTGWQFVLATPHEGTENVKIESPISVTFSMPMDRASTEAAFTVTEVPTPTASAALPGVFDWSADGTALSFKPTRALQLGTRYLASVGKSAKAASSGQAALRAVASTEFTTVFPPKILRTDPREGEARAAPSGGVSFEFLSPIVPASVVSGTVTILPKPTRVFTSYSDWDNILYVNFDKLPDTAYTITLSSRVADAYGNLLGQDAALHFRTREYDPILQLNSNGYVGTYNAYTSTIAAVTYRNVPQLNFTLWRVTDQEFVSLTGQNYGQKWENYKPNTASKLREWRVQADAPHNAIGIAITELQAEAGKPLPPGLYYLTVDDGTSSGGRTRQLVARTTLNLTLKSWSSGALAWATDLKTGQPVAGVDVTFTDGAALDRHATTDRDGIAQVALDLPRQPWEPLLALGRSGDGGFGVASSAWTDGISPWDFRVSSAGVMPPYKGYLYTDRPIYRPGQTVYWKAVIRRDDDAIYALPAPGQPVSVTINDGEGKALLSQQLTLDGMGSVNGKLVLDSEASLGYYYLSVLIPNPAAATSREAQPDRGTSVGVGFQVAEYRKPEYEVSAQTDRPEYIQGEQIKTTVQANYFFGQPVKGAKVQWVLLTSDYSFGLPDETQLPKGGPYSFADWDWYAENRSGSGGLLSEGEGVTDAEGRYSFSVPADITRFAQSQRLTFDITILDAGPQGTLGSGQAVSTQADAIVHKGEFYIGLRPQSYVAAAGKPTATDVLTVDTQGKPAGSVEVALVANRIRWYSVREQAEDGQYYWMSKAEKTAVYSETLSTAGDGTALFAWTPKEPGEYKVEASARDRSGHAVRSATYTWVGGADYVPWRQEDNDRIELVPDKKEYAIGDTAQLLAASPYQTPVKALLTVERGGVLQHQVIDVKRNSEVIALPIRADYNPNVYASLVLVKGMDATSPAPSFRMGLAQLNVSVADKELKVILTPRCGDVACNVSTAGTPEAAPRETITWTVQTLDAAGKPVAAQVSLALVDKAVLTLVEDAAGKIMDQFYRERGLGVTTGATLVMNVDRLVAQLAQGAKGGGGGGPGGELFVRREFPDTAYWNATVMTSADGMAEVAVTLPDSLTTWIMDARAATADTRVGQSTAELLATQDLLVRPVLPRFLIEGDKAQIAGIVHNNTKAEVEVEVRIEATGLQIPAPSDRKTTIKPYDTAKVTWPVTIQPGATEVKVTMRAAGGGLQDAVEITLPVYRYTTPEVVGTSGQISSDDSRLELFRLPPGADTTRAGLEVRLEPSLAAGMLGSLTYLEHYPYECTEQTVSRFLPNVVSSLAFKKLGVARPETERALAQQVGVGIQRLYSGQHLDGGWGWWPNDESNPTVSSYVVLGLAKAKQAGFTVDASALNQGIRYLKGQLKAPSDLKGWQLNQQAFLLYALAEAGAGEPNRAGALYEKREALSLDAKAYLTLALGLIDPQGAYVSDAASPSRIKTLLADITSRAITSGTSTHWEEGWIDYWNMGSDTRSTAIILDVLARLDPKHSLAPNAVRWLMGARKADHWETTQESAWAIVSLTDWMAATGELEGDYAWRVLLNSVLLGQGQVKPATVSEVTTLRADVAKLLVDQTNALVLQREAAADQTGKGQLYYTVQLTTYQPVEKIGPLNRGVIISREYRLADCGLPAAEADAKAQAASACPIITKARVGDVLDVRLHIVAPHALYYLIVEDPLPAGTEAIDTSLRTTSRTAQGPEVQQVEKDAKAWMWSWWWTPTHTELRDEKVSLFATWLDPGSYEFRYQIRASLPGEFLTLPPTAYQMYHPEVWGRGAGGVFTIGE